MGLTTYDAKDPDTKFPPIKPTDWTQARDLAKENPRGAQAPVPDRGGQVRVLPLDDRTYERFNPDLAGRPQFIKGKTQILFGRHGNGSPRTRSCRTRSPIRSLPTWMCPSPARRASSSRRAATHGWSLYAKSGKLKYCYNLFGITLTFVEAMTPIPAGHRQVRMESKYDGGGLAKGGGVTLYVDGKEVGKGRVEQTVPMLFFADETCDVGKRPARPCRPTTGPKATHSAAR